MPRFRFLSSLFSGERVVNVSAYGMKGLGSTPYAVNLLINYFGRVFGEPLLSSYLEALKMDKTPNNYNNMNYILTADRV